MIVAIGVIMYSTVTSFRHERWQEYQMIIGNIELSSQRVVEISLANYTWTMNNAVLRDNLARWQIDLAGLSQDNQTSAYPGFGVSLGYWLPTGSQQAYGWNITYIQGLASQWNKPRSYSAANVTLSLNLTSVGLTGYKFVASAFLGVILNATYDDDNNLVISIAVEKEDLIPVTNLDKDDFFINNTKLAEIPHSTLTHFYEMDNGVLRSIYRIVLPSDPTPSNVFVAVVDSRKIMVVANSTVT